MTKVFVYGTLLEGERNWQRFLNNEQSEKLGEAKVQGFFLYSLGAFPTVKVVDDVQNSACEVLGEVFEVSDDVFQRLDYLEGYPNFYNRIRVETPYGEAWIYVCREDYLDKRSELIPSGSWRQYLGQLEAKVSSAKSG